MNRLFLIVALVLVLPIPISAANIGVGVALDEPAEYYGEVDVKAVPDPWLVYEQPLIINSSTTVSNAAPVYLYVPGDHHRRWFKHCREYNACSLPVYFVKESWYKKVYVPAYYKNRGKPSARPMIILHGRGRRY